MIGHIERRLAIAALLLIAACSSSKSIVESNTYVNQPGDPIEISVEGLNLDPRMMGNIDQPFDFGVVVANNSDLDATVTQVNVFQNTTGAYVVSPVTVTEDVTIEPAKEHKFEVKMMARSAGSRNPMADYSRAMIGLRVVVTLSNSDRYVQQFEIPVRQ